MMSISWIRSSAPQGDRGRLGSSRVAGPSACQRRRVTTSGDPAGTAASEWAAAHDEKWLAGLSGGGTALEILRRAPPGSVVHGFDISPALIEVARRRAVPAQAAIAFEAADMARAVPPEPYERLVSRFGIMFFDELLAKAGDGALTRARQSLTARLAGHQQEGVVRMNARVHIFTGARPRKSFDAGNVAVLTAARCRRPRGSGRAGGPGAWDPSRPDSPLWAAGDRGTGRSPARPGRR